MPEPLSVFAQTRLAASLYAARDARLLRLFRDDRWLGRRVTAPLREWDGYQADLELANDYLLSAEGAVPMQPAQIVTHLVHHAFIRSNLGAADDIPTSIIQAAVKSGAWTVERARSTINRYRNTDDQAVAFIELLDVTDHDEERTKLQRTFLELAFLQPDRIPGRRILEGIHLLEPADQTVVSARLAAVCKVYPSGPQAFVANRTHENAVITAADVLRALRENPPAHSATLITRTIDSLLDEGAQIASRAASDESDQVASQPQLLFDVQQRDMAAITFGDYTSRTEILELLPVAAGYLSSYTGELQSVPVRLERVMGCASTASEWENLARPFADALARLGILWEPPDYSRAPRYSLARWAADEQRLYFMRETLLRNGNLEAAHYRPEETIYPYPPIEWLQSGWVDHAMKLLRQAAGVPEEEETEGGGDRHDVSETILRTPTSDMPDEAAELSGDPSDTSDDEGSDGPGSLLEEMILRNIAPITAAFAVIWSGSSPNEVDQLIPEVYDADQLPVQVFTLVNAIEEGTVDREVGRRTIGGLLRHALVLADEAGATSNAWAEIDPEWIATADLSPSVDFVMDQPIEEARNYSSELFAGDEDSRSTDIPFLNALRVVGPHLDIANAGRVLKFLLYDAPAQVRREGLSLVSTSLSAQQLESALAHNWKPVNARELVWALSELATGCDVNDTNAATLIEGYVLEAAAKIEQGWAYVDAILHRASRERFSANDAVRDRGVLQAVRRMTINNRTDALRGFSHHANRDEVVPAAVFDEILKLPASSPSGKYSWRAVALLSASAFLDSDQAQRALDSAFELPERFQEGPSNIWGRDWTTEYCRAATLNAIIPKLPQESLSRVFEYAKQLPYVAREPIFRSLADVAETELANAICDLSITKYREYASILTEESPFEVDGTYCAEPLKNWKAEREVQTSEIIAKIVHILSPDRLLSAAELAISYEATGPCSWLGSKLLGESHRALNVNWDVVTAHALVDAYALVSLEPARIDVLIDLLPQVKTAVGRLEATLREFIATRFPEFDGLFLDRAHGELLSAEDVKEYLLISGIGLIPRPDHVEEVAQGQTEADRRHEMAQWILSPAAQLQRDKFVVSLLLRGPLLSRLAAIPRLNEVLTPELLHDVLNATIKQLVENSASLDREAFARIAELAPTLPAAARDQLVGLIAADPSLVDADDGIEEIELATFESLYRDWGKVLRPHPRYAKGTRSVAARLLGEDIEHTAFRDAFAFVTPRVLLLEKLVPHLSPSAIAEALSRVRTLPEVERAGAYAALLQKGNHTHNAILQQIASLESRFARLWALFRSQSSLESNREELRPLAREVVLAYDDPRAVGAAAVFLLGYIGEQETFDILLEQIASARSDGTALQMIAVAARLAEGHSKEAALIDRVFRLARSESRYRGLLALSRANLNLAPHVIERRREIIELLAERLLQLSITAPADFLSELASEIHIFNLVWRDEDRVDVAHLLCSVGLRWAWP